jgi:hypothetical protein
MNAYPYQPLVTTAFTHSRNNKFEYAIDPEALEVFKGVIESHVASLTAEHNSLSVEMEQLKHRAQWIEPRLADYVKFNKWMEQAHPDIIDAYKKSTAVADKLDHANNEMIYPQSEAA